MALSCLDCGLLYADFPLDLNLPRAQWLEINPADSGVLCAACIVKRAATIPGATVVHAVVEIAPHGDLKVLARAMKKVLPPDLLADVVAHLDPLTPFVEFLQRKDREAR